MKTILASAYAINPYKGSEDGMGWNFVLQIARYNKVIAITRINNRENIEKYIFENPNTIYRNITFMYFDLPYWARFWKRGSRGAMFYFYLWQRCLPRFIKSKKIEFDVAHNLNFHNDWTPSYLWKLNKPFVWGPIGHHPNIPSSFLKTYNTIELLKEKLSWLIKKYFWNISIDLKQTKNKANHILCMNSSVPKELKLSKANYSIIPSVATQDYGWLPNYKSSKFKLISAGRLVSLKGFDITIISFANFYNSLSSNEKNMCELTIVGSGPELDNYIALTKKLKIEKNVTFISWLSREDLLKLFKTSSAFLFPSHEGAGMVVAEALSFGLPVLCLDNYGPGEFINETCGIKVSYKNVEETISELSTAITKLFKNPGLLEKLRIGARLQFENRFDWNIRGEEFKNIYLNI